MQFINNNKLKFTTLTLISLLSVCLIAFVSFMPLPKGNYKLVNSVPVNANFLTSDFLKSAYVINNKNQVVKYDSTGNVLNTFNEERYGKLTSIDATSPFNVVMFYKDFSTLITTDMRLNTKRLYKLSTLGLTNVAAVCLANDNYIWVYDMNDGKLKKIDHNYQIIVQSLSMPQLLGETIEPNFLVESNGLLYLNVPGMGIMMFDIFGTFYTAISNSDLGTDQLTGFQVVDHKVVYFRDEYLFIYDIATRQQEAIAVPGSDKAKAIRVEKGRLYMLNNDNTLNFYMQTN